MNYMPPAAVPAAAAAPARSQALLYDGRIGELYGIFLLNILFTVLTLGIFRFWAITRYRRYLWSRMRFQGERFEYIGTGGELFVGYLLAGLALLGAAIVAFGAAYGLSKVSEPLGVVPILLFYVFVAVLAAGAVFSAQRYRLTRTLWRGIRGGMTGSMLGYGLRAILYQVLAVVTLLQLVPWVQVRLAERRIDASSFGTARFQFRGSARRLYLPWLATLVGTAVAFWATAAGVWVLAQATLPKVKKLGSGGGAEDAQAILALVLSMGWTIVVGLVVFAIAAMLISSWYSAAFERHVVGNTTLGRGGSAAGRGIGARADAAGTVRFSSSMTGGGLFGLMLGNLLIAVATLGLGYPILLHRNARFLARTLWVDGAVDAQALAQSTLAAPRFGEGMFQQLDAAGGVL